MNLSDIIFHILKSNLHKIMRTPYSPLNYGSNADSSPSPSSTPHHLHYKYSYAPKLKLLWPSLEDEDVTSFKLIPWNHHQYWQNCCCVCNVNTKMSSSLPLPLVSIINIVLSLQREVFSIPKWNIKLLMKIYRLALNSLFQFSSSGIILGQCTPKSHTVYSL